MLRSDRTGLLARMIGSTPERKNLTALSLLIASLLHKSCMRTASGYSREHDCANTLYICTSAYKGRVCWHLNCLLRLLQIYWGYRSKVVGDEKQNWFVWSVGKLINSYQKWFWSKFSLYLVCHETLLFYTVLNPLFLPNNHHRMINAEKVKVAVDWCRLHWELKVNRVMLQADWTDCYNVLYSWCEASLYSIFTYASN